MPFAENLLYHIDIIIFVVVSVMGDLIWMCITKCNNYRGFFKITCNIRILTSVTDCDAMLRIVTYEWSGGWRQDEQQEGASENS
jgi:hypothetical protein